MSGIFNHSDLWLSLFVGFLFPSSRSILVVALAKIIATFASNSQTLVDIHMPVLALDMLMLEPQPQQENIVFACRT